MTGLEKMTDQILEEANNSAGAKLEDAKKQAEVILNEAREEASREAKDISASSVQECAAYRARMKSSADLRSRTALLQAKQEMIAQVIDEAYAQFCSREGDAYYETLLDMLGKFALDQDGVIYFSGKDLERLPGDFRGKAAQVAKSRGGTLTVSDESRNIEKGFILAYGDIEENCSFRALFESQRDELQDKVQAILFS